MRNKSLFITISAAFWAVIFCVLMLLYAKEPHFAPNSDYFNSENQTVSAIRFNELDGLSRVQYANFTANEFEMPVNIREESDLPTGKLVDFEKFVPNCQRGTYQFIVAHVDVDDEEGREQFKNGLDKFREYDGYFHVSLFIPPIFSSAVIYVGREIVAKFGDIADYEYASYNENYTSNATVHSSLTEGVYLDLKFTSRTIADVPTGLAAAQLVTIHFETEPNKLGGVRGVPLIGSEEEVYGHQNGITNFYVTMLVLASVIFVTFAFLFIVKRSSNFLPHLGVSLAGILMLVSRICLNTSTAVPFLWSAFGMASSGLLALAACVSIRVKIRKFPLWTLTAAIASVNAILNFVMAYMPPTSFASWHIYRIIVAMVLGALIFAQAVIYSWQKDRPYATVTPVLAAVFTAVLPFLDLYEMLYPTSPALYLFAGTLLSTFTLSVWHFVMMERTNKQLTTNLSNEVQRRTENLKKIVDERDRLLRYVSHDMKKPIASIKRFSGELLATETDVKKKQQLQVICNKIDGVEENLVELQKYARLNFSQEQPQPCDVYDVINKVFTELSPDCIANDIILHSNAQHVRAYLRFFTLEHVFKNLIFNAIEHANCRNVYLSAYRSNNRCVATVSDDGTGIEDVSTMFEAYATAGNEENLGLGLYICRELMRDMGGDLTYSREDDKTVFTLTLPLT